MDSRAVEEAPLLVGDRRRSYTMDVHILSISFLLIFLAYGAAQNIESTVNKDLGTISLGVLYLSFTFCSMFASFVVRRIGSKNALVLGTTGYWLFVAANLKPSWYTMVPASLYLGFSASIIWVGQGTYLTSVARSHAKLHGLHEGPILGVFNGEFWAVFASHQLFGNLVTLALLRDGKEGSTSNTTLLMTVFLTSMTLGTLLMCFLCKSVGEDGTEAECSSVGFCDSLIRLPRMMITPLLNKTMLLIIPLLAYTGLQSAFVWAEFTKDIVTPAMGVSGVGGAMAIYGAFNAACSITVGKFTSGLKSITVIVIGGVVAQAAVFLWLLLGYRLGSRGVVDIIYPLVMAAILGVGDGVLRTQSSALIGLLFKEDTEGAFGQGKVWESGAIAMVFFVSPYISMDAMLLLLLVSSLTRSGEYVECFGQIT